MNSTISNRKCIPCAVLNLKEQANSRPLKRTAINRNNYRHLKRSERIVLAMLRAAAKSRAKLNVI